VRLPLLWFTPLPTVAAGLRDLVHQRARLGILTVLGEADRVDFPYLKSLLQATGGDLGRGDLGRGDLGRGVLAAETAALKQLVQRDERRRLRPAPPS
jgi:hypothetical protein